MNLNMEVPLSISPFRGLTAQAISSSPLFAPYFPSPAGQQQHSVYDECIYAGNESAMKKALVIALVISLLFAFAWIARDYFTVDRCLDQGGRWNEISRECEVAQQSENSQ